jgi:hypothetical protein
MPPSQPQFSKEEFARRGDAIYERHIRPLAEPAHNGKFVVIDVESGDFEIDQDDYAATEGLLARRPQAQMWLVRIGERAAYRIGARPFRESP